MGLEIEMKQLVKVLCGLAFGCATVALASGRGNEVVVIYNNRMPESRELAFYYAQRREVPTNQVFGFNLPTTEAMKRAEFRDDLQKPLLKALERQKLFVIRSDIIPATRDKTGDVVQKVTAARVRYATLCYGVPVRILSDPDLSEPGAEKMRPEMRRNEASVDSELAALPMLIQGHPLYGPARNAAYGVTNAAWLHPTNGVWMVARLDGPSAQIARGLVDKAMDAETNGLWGRAYFDLRGLTNSNYKVGDDWIRSAADIIRRVGFETVVDDQPETFTAAFPMSQIAFYAGWYDGQVSGPFTRPKVEFMPGALAYHLHSFSAHTLRAPDQYWVGPLLAKGATATMGYVEEPYLEGTVNVAALVADFTFFGFSFGEAAYAAQQVVSWQTTVVGDPLYCPFGRKIAGEQIGDRFRDLHLQLLEQRSKLIEWSHLQMVNLNLAMGHTAAEAIGYLEQEPVTQKSSVLLEKLATMYYTQGKLSDAFEANGKALQLPMAPLQRARVLLAQAQLLATFVKEEQALDLYQQFLKEFPDYPDPLGVYQKMLPLARTLKKTAEVEKIQKELERLSPPAEK
jgi:uncharacterized protein (TIGR03790 family)